MHHHHADQDPLPSQLKRLIVAMFRLDLAEPDRIADDEPLIGGNLGLDSLDALELAIRIEEEYGLTIHSREDSHRAFASIASLANFIRTNISADRAQLHGMTAAPIQLPLLPAIGSG